MVSTVLMDRDSTFCGASRQGEKYSTPQYAVGMSEPNERLQIARRKAGYADATDAARAFGWNENTYRSHENGMRGLKTDVAERYAKAFRVSSAWLLTGEGNADRQNTVAVMGRIGAGAEIEPENEQIPPEGLYDIEAPFPVPDDSIAFEVVGESMWPRYDPGDIIICWASQSNIEEVVGWEAAIRLTDGRRFLKRILHGSSKSTYDLESHNAAPIRGVRIEWVGAIQSVIRSGQWRKLNGDGKRRLLRRITR